MVLAQFIEKASSDFRAPQALYLAQNRQDHASAHEIHLIS